MRAFVLAPLLAAATACVEVDTRVVLSANGSGSMSSRTVVTGPTMDAFRKMDALMPEQGVMAELEGALPHKPTRDEKRLLAAAGLRKVKVAVDESDGLVATLACRFDRPAALQALGAIGAKDMPTLRITPDGEGYVASFKNQGSAMTQPATDTPPDPAKAAEMMGIVGTLMGEMSKFRVALALELPGAVSSADPSSFAAIDGGTVRWTLDASTLTTLATSGGFDKDTLTKEGFRAWFSTPSPLPAGIVQ